MITQFTKRLITETDPRCLGKFAYNFGWKGMKAVRRFQNRLKKGETFPAFLFLSVTNNCNLSCQGCWVTPTKPVRELSTEALEKTIVECKAQGSCFFGILGGEPLLYPGLFDIFKRHPDCYFLLFTNGTGITEHVAETMKALGNVSPLISIEGNGIVSDQRRGGKQVYFRTLKGLENCSSQGLITGVATSVCKSNIRDLASESFIRTLIQNGVHYLWYYIYRPVGPKPCPELALSGDEIIHLRKFMIESRKKYPLLIVDAYWDHQGRALCPAATGISHHIGPGGDVEPCPPVQFAQETINNGKPLYETLVRSDFLKNFRDLASSSCRGCILMERPNLLYRLVSDQKVKDSSGRSTALKELRAMVPRESHDMPGYEIPETYWPYRFAKKHWFFGFGAYG